MLQESKPSKVKEQSRLYYEIREGILSGRFLPGEKLVVEELANSFGSSRTTVVIALSTLEKEGLLHSEDYKGYKVKKLPLSEALQYLEVRGVLEGYVGRLAATLVTDNGISNLQKSLKQMHYHLNNKDYAEYSKTNAAFHEQLYAIAGNAVLSDIILNLKARMVRFQFRTSFIPGRLEESFKEHTAIFEAVKKHDPDVAEKALITHVVN